MASYYEPMDVDETELEPDFDKENAFRPNVKEVPKTPTAEKGFEDLDVSELNMKLRMSCTPMASPTPRRFTGSCNQKLFPESGDNSTNMNLSDNSNVTVTYAMGDHNDNSMRSNLTIEAEDENENKNRTVLQHTEDSRISEDYVESRNETITTESSKQSEKISTPSIFITTTPVISPTKIITNASTSPIMRGLKSVLSMFRPSQSPIIPAEESTIVPDTLNPSMPDFCENLTLRENMSPANTVLVSTPVQESEMAPGHQSVKGNSPHIPESIVFSEDLMNELQWNDDTTIIFNKHKLPGRKLYTGSPLRESSSSLGSHSRDSIPSVGTPDINELKKTEESSHLFNKSADVTVEYMDISINDSTFHQNFIESNVNQIGSLEKPETVENIVESIFENVLETDHYTVNNFNEDSTIEHFEIQKEINMLIKESLSSDEKDLDETFVDAVDTSYADNSPQDNGQNIRNQSIIELKPLPEVNISDVIAINKQISAEFYDIPVTAATVLDSSDNIQIVQKREFKSQSNEKEISKESIESDLAEENTANNNDFTFDVIDNPFVTKPRSVTLPHAGSLIVPNAVSEIEENLKNVNEDVLQPENDNIDHALPPNVKVHETSIDAETLSLDSLNGLIMDKDLALSLTQINVPLKPEDILTELFTAENAIVENVSDTTTNFTEPQIVNTDISLVNTFNNEICVEDNILSSESNSPYVSLSAPTNEERIPNKSDFEAKFDEIQQPFGTNSSQQSTQQGEINFNEIENPFVTKTRISISPPLPPNYTCVSEVMKASQDENKEDLNRNEMLDDISTKSINLDQINELNDSVKSDGTKVIEDSIVIREVDKPELKENNEKLDNDVTVNNEISPNGNIQHDVTELTLSSITITNGKFENVHLISPTSRSFPSSRSDIYSIEHSLVYESADNSSGSTSQQLLESDLENIEDIKSTDKQEFNCENTFETKSKSNTSPLSQIHSENFDLENPFMTQNKIRMSPPLTENAAPLNEIFENVKISEETSVTTDCNMQALILENPFMTQNKIRMSPPLTEITTPTKDIFENIKISEKPSSSPLVQENTEIIDEIRVLNEESPFVTKTKISLSPPLIKEQANTFSPKIQVNKVSPISMKKSPSKLMKMPDFNCDNPFETKNKMRVSPPPTMLGQYDGIKDNEESMHEIENIFATTSKIKMSPTLTPEKKLSDIDFKPISLDENPFLTKSKIRLSPPITKEIYEEIAEIGSNYNTTLVLETTELISEEKLQKNDGTLILPKELDSEIKLLTSPNRTEISKTEELCQNSEAIDTAVISNSEHPDKDASMSSDSSNMSDERDITIREVNTEDEDTIEGPNYTDLDMEVTENPFESKSKIRLSSPVFDKCIAQKNSPQVIKCSDLKEIEEKEKTQPSNEFQECTDKEFKPAELFFNADEFDFLMNQNTAGETNDFGKKSLFLKFDPLCAINRISTGVAAALANDNNGNNMQIAEESHAHVKENMTMLDTTVNSIHENCSPSKIEESNETIRENDLSSSTRTEKPTMAVIPAIIDQAMGSNSPFTPTRTERRSIIFSSPAIAAIDRLISLSGNNTPNQTAPERYSQESADAIMQIRFLLSEKEEQVQQLRAESKQLQDRLAELQIQMMSLQEDNEKRLKKINELQTKLAHKTVLNKNMTAAVEEYERTISGMISENEQVKQKHQQDRANLIRERDEQVAHLASMEVSFSDLHTKYERTKQIILAYKSNEVEFRKTIEEYKSSVSKLENNYEILKQQATSKLNNSNLELEKIKKAHEAEVLKLTAQVKRKELHAASLEESLALKIKANEELTAICDELISKVG